MPIVLEYVPEKTKTAQIHFLSVPFKVTAQLVLSLECHHVLTECLYCEFFVDELFNESSHMWVFLRFLIKPDIEIKWRDEGVVA